ncbi:uncharacterized protein G2W53_025078 [Senna tora]|uniref:Uncharacterized protein n=1 Tax=Senna tora TaxID=362788 RepID=A0A834TCS8_9FABA|nr:uncharacterized protein G2W53_025078 [Senna tora]
MKTTPWALSPSSITLVELANLLAPKPFLSNSPIRVAHRPLNLFSPHIASRDLFATKSLDFATFSHFLSILLTPNPSLHSPITRC